MFALGLPWAPMEGLDDSGTSEPEHLVQDFLTCGVCQKEFALSDIVKFIQHKVHSCNKENCILYDGDDTRNDGYDSADGSTLPVGGGHQRTRAAGPPPMPPTVPTTLPGRKPHAFLLHGRANHHHHGVIDLKTPDKGRGLVAQDNGDVGTTHVCSRSPPTQVKKAASLVDAEVNTTYTAVHSRMIGRSVPQDRAACARPTTPMTTFWTSHQGETSRSRENLPPSSALVAKCSHAEGIHRRSNKIPSSTHGADMEMLLVLCAALLMMRPRFHVPSTTHAGSTMHLFRHMGVSGRLISVSFSSVPRGKNLPVRPYTLEF